MAKELRFPVEIDDSKAAKELNKLESSIGRLKDKIAKNEAARNPIVERLKEAQTAAVDALNRVEQLKAALAESEAKTSLTGNADPDTFYNELQRQAQIKAELAEQEKIMQAKEKEAQKLEAADAKILNTLKEQTEELEKAKERAGELTKQITDASKGKSIKAAFASAAESIKSATKNTLRWGLGITGVVMLVRRLRTYLVEAVKSFAENDPETKANIEALKSSLATLKASWGAAFAPVLNAVVPILQTLISWLTTAANAVAQFFAVLSGKGTFKKAIANTGQLSSNLGSTADNAKEAKKQLMGIDELNVLSDTESSSGGSGSGGANADALGYEEVAVSEWLLENFELVKDIVIAIGGALAGWALGKILSNLGLIKGGFKEILGFALLVSGAVVAIKGGIDAWSNGVNWQNLIEMVGGIALAAVGAALAFGKVGAAAVLLVGGIAMLVIGIREWIQTGELTHETCLLIVAGLVAIGIALTAATGGISLIVAAVIALALVIYNYWGEISAWVKENVTDPVAKWWGELKSKVSEYVETIKDKWEDIKSKTSQTWSTIETSLTEKINSIKQVFDSLKEKAASVKESLVNKFESMRSALSGIVERIKSLFNFQFQLPQLRLPHIQVQWQAVDSLLARFLGISALPHLSVEWYAKGGIVDGATLIGAGEAGKEAIVPLERNTQWVNMVARELADLLFDRDVFTEIADRIAGIPSALDRMTAQLAELGSIQMPAVAMGTVVPPNTTTGSYGGISTELESKLDALLSKLGADNSQPIQVNTTVELDGRQVAKAIYQPLKDEQRRHGTSFVEY